MNDAWRRMPWMNPAAARRFRMASKRKPLRKRS